MHKMVAHEPPSPSFRYEGDGRRNAHAAIEVSKAKHEIHQNKVAAIIPSQSQG